MVLGIIWGLSALLIILALVKFLPPVLLRIGEFVDNALDIKTDTPEE